MRTISPNPSGGSAGGPPWTRPLVDPLVEVVVPVYNEAGVLDTQIRRLHEALRGGLPMRWRITIVDNGSVDGTAALARELAATLPSVDVVALPEKGRGRALRAGWSASPADVLVYTDVDLSTDLHALLPLVAPLVSGHSALATGSRLLRQSRVRRSLKRELISRAYNRVLRLVVGLRVRDAQCGFKALRADVAAALLPEVADEGWFFDTELLVRAQRHGLRVAEIPVDWVEDPDSRVRLVRTAWDDLAGVARLVRELGLRRPSGALLRPLAVSRPEAA